MNLISGISMLIAGAIPISIFNRINRSPLKSLSLILSLFLLIHASYHIFEIIQIELFASIGDLILEPLSLFFFLIFLIYLTIKGG